jgi:YVTN family beta-propeller protein
MRIAPCDISPHATRLHSLEWTSCRAAKTKREDTVKSLDSTQPGRWQAIWSKADILFVAGAATLLTVILLVPWEGGVIRAAPVDTLAVSGNAIGENDTIASGSVAYVAVSNWDYLALVDTATHVVSDTIDLAPAGCSFPWRVAIPPDGETVWVSCRNSSNLVVIDRDDNTIVTTVGGYLSSPEGISFTHDGAYALVGSSEIPRITVVDTTHYFQAPIDTPGLPASIAVHPHLPLAYATNRWGNLISVIDTEALAVMGYIDIGTHSHSAVVSRDGSRLYTANHDDSSVSVIDTRTMGEIAHIAGLSGKAHSLALSPDGQELYVTTGSGGIVEVIDTELLLVHTSITIDPTGNFDFPWGAELTCDGEMLVVTNARGEPPQTHRQVAMVDTTTHSPETLISMPDTNGDGYPDWGARGVSICPQYVPTGVFLSPLPRPKRGGHGEVVAHEELLFNLTRAVDSFSLVLGDNTWDTTLSTNDLGPVAHGDALTFTVHVTVPVDAEWYLTDTVVITATSVASPTVHWDAVALTTQAYAPPEMSVWPQALTSTHYLGKVETRTLTISNGDAVTLTFAVTGCQDHEIPGTQHKSFTPLHDIDGYRWTDGGNDAFDSFGDPVLSLGGHLQPILMEEGIHSYTIDDYPVIVHNSFPAQNVYRMTIKAAPGAETRTDMFVAMGGDMGSDGSTVTMEQSFDFAGRNIRYLVNNDWGGNTGGDPQVVFLLLPSAPEDQADVVYQSVADQVSFYVANVSPPVSIYIVVSYHDLPDIEQWFMDELAIADELPGWLAVDPQTGTVATNSSEAIEFSFGGGDGLFGTYTTQVLIHSDDPITAAVSIPITMTTIPWDQQFLPLVTREHN